MAFVVDCSPILRKALRVLASNYSPVQPCRVFHGATALAEAMEWCSACSIPDAGGQGGRAPAPAPPKVAVKEVAAVRRELRQLPDIPMEWYELNGF